MKFEHHPVLLKEAVEALNVRPNFNYVDGTLGGGGHALEILKRNSPKGLLVGIDRDPNAIFFVRKKLSAYRQRTIFINDNYSNLKKIIYDTGISKINGILLDLGLSSYQLEDGKRGFSFKAGGVLDMRMGPGNKPGELTAKSILNTYSQDQLQDIFSRFGEERYSKSIARLIVQYRKKRKFESTDQLTALIEDFYANKPKPRKIHPATKIYQALRIEVNQELEGLSRFLEQAVELIQPGGRLVIISFHSLEDKIVKNFFKINAPKVKMNKYSTKKTEQLGRLKIITKKPIQPSLEEVQRNPRARSAKMRVAEII